MVSVDGASGRVEQRGGDSTAQFPLFRVCADAARSGTSTSRPGASSGGSTARSRACPYRISARCGGGGKGAQAPLRRKPYGGCGGDELEAAVKALEDLLAAALRAGDLLSFSSLKRPASPPPWRHQALEQAQPPPTLEALIQNLFTKMGLEARHTRPSRDGGVDCVAWDPRPIFGGKVVIQAKRYKNTVGVSAVRDLFGTLRNEGASRESL